jgi:hypothetical protein
MMSHYNLQSSVVAREVCFVTKPPPIQAGTGAARTTDFSPFWFIVFPGTERQNCKAWQVQMTRRNKQRELQ